MSFFKAHLRSTIWAFAWQRARSIGAFAVSTTLAISLATTLAMINQQACAQTFANEAVARGVSYFVSQGEFGGLGQFGCGVAVVDLDGDGDDDIVCTGNAKDRLGFFRNGGAGQFSDVSAETGLGVILKASGIAAGDFDADGDLDLAVTRWLKATVLLRNDSTSSNAWAFVDVAAASGITGVGAGAGCAWGDYNGDGWIDLAVANRSGTNANLTRNKLWRNNNGTSFTEVAGTLGVDNVMFPAFMVTWCDIDLDGDADMYVANDKGSANPHFNRLYRNNGNGTFFEDVDCRANVSADAMGTSYGDLNGDGAPEIYVPNVQLGNFLLRANDSGLNFFDDAANAGVECFSTCWGSTFLDGDNDGDLDLFVGAMITSLNFYFRNDGAWPLTNVALGLGLADPNDTYCVAQGDVDRDGDIDLLVQDRAALLRLYINGTAAQSANQSIMFDVKGRGANTHALGTRLIAVSQGRKFWREVAAGSDYKSQSSYRQHIGLGTQMSLDSLTVTFPKAGALAGATRQLTNLPAGQVWPLWPPESLGDENRNGVLSSSERVKLIESMAQTFAPIHAIFDFDGDSVVGHADLREFDARQCDLDHNGIVGASDLTILLSAWGSNGVDFDEDGMTGASDLAMLLARWS